MPTKTEPKQKTKTKMAADSQVKSSNIDEELVNTKSKGLDASSQDLSSNAPTDEFNLGLSDEEKEKESSKDSKKTKEKETKKKDDKSKDKKEEKSSKKESTKKDEKSAKFLKKVKCIIDVNISDGDVSSTEEYKKKLEEAGATVQSRISKNVTHIVFKDGKQSLLDSIKKEEDFSGVIVSPLWVDACLKKGELVDEKDFKLDLSSLAGSSSKKKESKKKDEKKEDSDKKESKKSEEKKEKTEKKEKKEEKDQKEEKKTTKKKSDEDSKKASASKDDKKESKKTEEKKKSDEKPKSSKDKDSEDVEMEDAEDAEKSDSKNKPSTKKSEIEKKDTKKEDKKAEKAEKKESKDTKKSEDKKEKKSEDKKEKKTETKKTDSKKDKEDKTTTKKRKADSKDKSEEKKAKKQKKEKEQPEKDEDEAKFDEEDEDEELAFDDEASDDEDMMDDSEEEFDWDNNYTVTHNTFKENVKHSKKAIIAFSSRMPQQQKDELLTIISDLSAFAKAEKSALGGAYTGERFTHLIAEDDERSDKVFFAIAFGAYIVTPSWLRECLEKKTLLNEQPYLRKRFLPAIMKSKEANTPPTPKKKKEKKESSEETKVVDESSDSEDESKKNLKLFANNTFSIIGRTKMSRVFLETLITLCGGEITAKRLTPGLHYVIVGEDLKPSETGFNSDNTYVTESFLFESLSNYDIPNDISKFSLHESELKARLSVDHSKYEQELKTKLVKKEEKSKQKKEEKKASTPSTPSSIKEESSSNNKKHDDGDTIDED